MAPYHRIYRIALVLLLAAVSGCGGNEAPDTSVPAATQDDQAKTELEKGNGFLDREDYDTAIACYTEVIRLKPDDAMAYHSRGATYFGKGEYAQAIKDYTEAIRLDPNNALAYRSRRWAYKEKGDQQKANADFDKAKSLDPDFYERYSPQ